MRIRIATEKRPPYQGPSIDDSYPLPVHHMPKCVALDRPISADPHKGAVSTRCRCKAGDKLHRPDSVGTIAGNAPLDEGTGDR